MLDQRKSHVKYWRPQILLMVAHPRHCCQLMDFINDIKKSGLYVIGHVKLGKLADHDLDPVTEVQSHWLSLIDHLKVKAFAEVTLADTVSEGLHHLVWLSGIGGMKPNTVCFGFFDSTVPVDTLSKTKLRRRKFLAWQKVSDNFDRVEHFFEGPRSATEQKQVTSLEYVDMIRDVLKMGKNVALFRHFSKLDKNDIFDASETSFIDVWPVNLFRPETGSFFDNTCLFLLQLACILNMVHGWKSKTTLRVFLCINAQTDNTIQKEQKLDMFLRQLRIIAKIQIVSWDSLQQHMDSPYLDFDYDGSHMNEYNRVSEAFVKAMNELIIANSSRTAVSFFYLPKPPIDPADSIRYLSDLDLLTNDLKPSVLVHGLHPVTSTTL